MGSKTDAGDHAKAGPRQSAVHIPLDFETAVSGLLRVKPKKAAAETPPAPKAGAKKPAAKKAARKKKP